ncbi:MULTISPECIES: DUF3010 family protein [Marinobacter]|uniref:DUF3010 family protein n=2 Tax=Marinobacter TaxID=2742 RepID=A0A455WFA7_MARNT|nr:MULTISPECIES: DUF3010 family protein [unclassified Marinobacter]QFS88044.1 hypothetical protein FIV08_14515 [Marinobacter sp. THAF197a]QFT51829.1 hypothetical protein FIU96_14425 [Marinobacter sp. THAF39]BBJ04913.1 hypothetical protein YBY_27620 [Marinobacter nauticus]
MIICGVELTASDAVLCLLKLDRGLISLPECKVRRLSLVKNHTREDLKQFQAAFAELMAEHGVTRVAIKERMPKGKFAGGAISFKLEATIQLIADPDLEVRLLPPALIKSTLAANPLPIHFEETGLKAFQETAFIAAYVGLMAKQ